MRFKSNASQKGGKLIPIAIPNECCEVINIDFITQLHVSDGFDVIMTVVDKLSKRPIYVPITTNATAEDTAKILFNNVVRVFGIPKVITVTSTSVRMF